MSYFMNTSFLLWATEQAPQGQRPSRPGFCKAKYRMARPVRSTACVRTEEMAHRIYSMSMNNENDQANRAISTGKLHTLLRFHTRPINVVVFHGSQGNTRFQVGFPLRCLQRLSIPYIATLLCPWQDNRSTRDMSIPVLSY